MSGISDLDHWTVHGVCIQRPAVEHPVSLQLLSMQPYVEQYLSVVPFQALCSWAYRHFTRLVGSLNNIQSQNLFGAKDNESKNTATAVVQVTLELNDEVQEHNMNCIHDQSTPFHRWCSIAQKYLSQFCGLLGQFLLLSQLKSLDSRDATSCRS